MKTRLFLSNVVLAFTFLLMVYIIVWWGVVEPLVVILFALDKGILSFWMLVGAVLQFFLKGAVAGLVFLIGTSLSKFIAPETFKHGS